MTFFAFNYWMMKNGYFTKKKIKDKCRWWSGEMGQAAFTRLGMELECGY